MPLFPVSFLALVLSAGSTFGVASARAAGCTVQVSKSVPRERWTDVAFISRSVAESIARHDIERLGLQGSLTQSILTVTEGCLIWSIKLRVTGDKALSTAQIDAGDGRLLNFKRAAVKSREWWYE